ncbi:MAG: proton-conducting transporter membrane subunit [Anaerolineaceae bacterium]
MSNSAIIWIVLPVVLGIGMAFIQRFRKLSAILGTLFPLIFAVLALIFSNGLTLIFLGRAYTIADSLTVFGRTIQITADQLDIIALLYFLCFAWNLGSRLFSVSQWFTSLSLVITALWVSVQFINPFLYSAVVIELIALISVPLLSPRGTPAQSGVLRFLSMQTLAMPLILLSGWMVSGIETSPSAEVLVLRGSLLVIAGFSLWAGIFPLHSWLPMLTEETHPWVISFLQTIMQIGIAIFFLKFLNQYAWLRNQEEIKLVLKWIGALCIISGGILSFFQTKLSRIFGYLFLAGTGYIVLTMAFQQQGWIDLLTLHVLPRAFAYWSLGYSLSMLREALGSESLYISELKGLIWRYPRISTLLFISFLNILGMPLFSLFPSNRLIWSILARESLVIRLLISIGLVGMILMFLRVLSMAVQPADVTEQDKQERPLMLVPVVLIVLIMVLAGLFPQFFSAPVQNLFISFHDLLP